MISQALRALLTRFDVRPGMQLYDSELDQLHWILKILENQESGAGELNLDTDESNKARALHRIVRAVHDGNCPACGYLASAAEFRRHDESGQCHICPRCTFTVSVEEAVDALTEFLPFQEKSLAIFYQWRIDRARKRNSKANATAGVCEHEFDASVTVNKITEISAMCDKEHVGVQMADVRIWCRKCAAPMVFNGLKVGMDYAGARVSVDGEEARLSIREAGSEAGQ